MTEKQNEHLSPVVELPNGKRSATITSKNGKIRVTSDVAAKQVDICLVDGSLNRDCLSEISYSAEPALGVIPGLKVAGAPLVDIENMGTDLASIVSKALSGTKVELKDAEEIGALTSKINYTAQRQRGVKLQ